MSGTCEDCGNVQCLCAEMLMSARRAARRCVENGATTREQLEAMCEAWTLTGTVPYVQTPIMRDGVQVGVLSSEVRK